MLLLILLLFFIIVVRTIITLDDQSSVIVVPPGATFENTIMVLPVYAKVDVQQQCRQEFVGFVVVTSHRREFVVVVTVFVLLFQKKLQATGNLVAT